MKIPMHKLSEEGKPKAKGLYLVKRIWNYEEVWELIHFDGNFWVTGGTENDKILEYIPVSDFE